MKYISFRDGEQLPSESDIKYEGNVVTSSLKLNPAHERREVTCSVSNNVSIEVLSNTLAIKPAFMKTKASTETSITTLMASSISSEAMPQVLRLAPRIDMAADMPVPDEDIPEHYDYSHFDYLNER